MRRIAAMLPCCAAILAVLPTAAVAAAAHQAIAELNAQRSANGIPAGITQDRTWSADCAAHDHYMAVNHSLTPVEVPSAPGYTAGGAFAARNAVLIQAGNWDSGDPYASAPLHLDQLLAPRLLVAGSADLDGFSCTTTFPGWIRPDPPALTVYTYPGDGGAIHANETAVERPWTPGELVGIPRATRTGPYLIVLVDAPGQSPLNNPAGLSAATLTGPAGPVAVKTVDGDTPVPSGPKPSLGPYISPGGFIIPVAPLAPGARYRAHVVVSFAGVQTAHDWSFTAVGVNPQSRLRVTGMSLSFSSRSPAGIRVSFIRPGGIHAPATTIAPGRRVRLDLGAGTWQACGVQSSAAGFYPYRRCVAIVVVGAPVLRLLGPDLGGQSLHFVLRFSSVLRARMATLTVTPLTFRCQAAGCSNVPGRSVVSSIVIGRATLRFPLPAIGRGIRVSVATDAFQLADAPWGKAHAMNSYVRH